MQFKSLIASALISTSLVAADDSSSTWTTLTPTATYKNGITDYASTFGIAVEPITVSGSSSSSASTASAAQKKRDVVSQVSDGQIQATTSTAKAVSTKSSSTTKSSSSSTKAAATTAAAVSQITDGQIQATTSTSTSSSAKTTDAASQISDGQIQATTGSSSSSSSSSSSESTAGAASQVSDGQIQASTTSSDRDTTTLSSTSASSTATSADADINVVSCKTNGTLAMTVTDGILRDGQGRIGSIVANRQFQFDGPPPQAGAIYAAGWAITPDGNLAIGDNDVFYQCLSGSFYNLYDESIGGQCSPVHLEIVKLVEC